ncbi:hypothetical protein [Ferroacidibacillus organovorans]|uniref:Uncharacterized protein n=1 Tax=Ferroacidibacillus organovorans TaxID=1765683 RepID=A0A101XSQ4_9BACL|nr:hypothetical protein [Ferroacidibacillus organovorans]KUO96867.1 hypothetical protein ATW55_08655 [Ferroacidibacillus organovorans]
MNQSHDAPRMRGFVRGVILGVAATLGTLALCVVLFARYLETAGQQAAVPVNTPPVSSTNRVELYFPLERFLAWRSTPQLQMDMRGKDVHVHVNVHPIASLLLTLSVDIYGLPNVVNGQFVLRSVHGSIDHIPIPTSLLLGAIAREGSAYGVYTNTKQDELAIDKTFGTSRLVGFDHPANDLIISVPVSAVLRAAHGEGII